MANMEYRRFQNTLNDLLDCEEHIGDELSEKEAKARHLLMRLCRRLSEEFVEEGEDDDA